MYRGYRYYHQEFSSNRVATLGTPDGTFSYAYDGNGNLLTGNGRPVRSAILDHYAAALAALYNEQSDEESDEQSIKETTHAFL